MLPEPRDLIIHVMNPTDFLEILIVRLGQDAGCGVTILVILAFPLYKETGFIEISLLKRVIIRLIFFINISDMGTRNGHATYKKSDISKKLISVVLVKCDQRIVGLRVDLADQFCVIIGETHCTA